MEKHTKVNNFAKSFQQLKTFVCITAIQGIKDYVNSCSSKTRVINLSCCK